MQVATPLYPPLSRGQVSTPQNSAYRPGAATVVFLKLTVMVRLGMQIATPFIKGAGEYTAKPNLPGDESVYLFLGLTIVKKFLKEGIWINRK